MKLDKGFHNGSVSWQLHDHEQAEKDEWQRWFDSIWNWVEDFRRRCETNAKG